MADSTDGIAPTNRRMVLGGVGAVGLLGVTGAVAAACGSGNGASNGSGGGTTGGGTTGGGSTDGGGGGDDGSIAKTGDIPVGGGVIFANDNVVVTQPTAGTFKAFSATCTHQGCQVGSVSGGLINCPCHGSQYSIKDGSVVRAALGLNKNSQQPLPEKTVTVSGDAISVG